MSGKATNSTVVSRKVTRTASPARARVRRAWTGLVDGGARHGGGTGGARPEFGCITQLFHVRLLMQLNTLPKPAPAARRVVPHGWQPSVTAGDLLATRGPVTVPPDWWSWAGAHGGLLVALAAADATAAAPDVALRGSTAQLLRPVRGPLTLTSQVVHAGRRLTTVRTEGTADGRTALGGPLHLRVAGGADRRGRQCSRSPPRWSTPPRTSLRSCPPPTWCPSAATSTSAPPTTSSPSRGRRRPGSPRGSGCASEAGTPGPLRTTLLADALAPSLYAAMEQPAPVPTVELSIHHRAPAPQGEDPAPASTRVAEEGWLLGRRPHRLVRRGLGVRGGRPVGPGRRPRRHLPPAPSRLVTRPPAYPGAR